MQKFQIKYSPNLIKIVFWFPTRFVLTFLISLVFCFVFMSNVHAQETTYFIHSDHLGSTSVITQNGQVISKKLYYPYGSLRNPTSDIRYPTSERAFTGQVSDVTDSGLYYYNARYYDPKLAIFAQADLSDAYFGNRYTYVSNNPINRIDPSGNGGLPPICDLECMVLRDTEGGFWASTLNSNLVYLFFPDYKDYGDPVFNKLESGFDKKYNLS